MTQDRTNGNKRPAISPEQLRKIQEIANEIQYGSLELVFQNGILIQIERSEKIRMTKLEN